MMTEVFTTSAVSENVRILLHLHCLRTEGQLEVSFSKKWYRFDISKKEIDVKRKEIC